MAGVDRAFPALITAMREEGQLECDPEITYWRLWDQSEWAAVPGGSTSTQPGRWTDPDTNLAYRSLIGHLDEALSADAVVYWGDFLHMDVYQKHTADVLARRIGRLERQSAEDIVSQHLLLTEHVHAPLDHVITYGTTLSMNTPDAYAGLYGTRLQDFVRQIRRGWFRDGYSAQTARMLRREPSESWQGVDAALLCEDQSRQTAQREKKALVFFGRSHLAPEALARFARGVSGQLSLQPTWLPWGHEPAFWPVGERRRFRAAWPDLDAAPTHSGPVGRLASLRRIVRGEPSPRGGEIVQFDGLLDEISRASVVITDTYHLAVNAWRLGVPVVLVADRHTSGWNVNAGEATFARDKRVDLYVQLDAMDFLAQVATSADLRRCIPGIVAAVRDPRRSDAVFRRVQGLADISRAELSASVAALLNAPSEGSGRDHTVRAKSVHG